MRTTGPMQLVSLLALAAAACGDYERATSGANFSGGAQVPAANAAAEMPPASNAGDKYKAPGTNPFVVAAHDPFSTFGADVDTASYDIFRRDVNLGLVPQPASVRLEEYVNAFSYDYPAPTAQDEAPFKVSLAAAGQVFDRPSLLFRVGIKGRKPPPMQRRPANIVFLVDVSGSMDHPQKLPLVRKTIKDALEFLAPTDRVSIVSYAGGTSVRLAPTAVAEQASIVPAIDGLLPGGGTNGASGIELAYAQATAGFIKEGINHVVMCTDGDFNVGPSTTKELVDLIRAKRKTGVTLTMLGYGIGNLNDDLMEAVSDAGNGIYGVISDAQQMQRYVRERLLATLVHIAKDVKIQVEFNAERVLAYRLLGYENRAIDDRDFRNDGIDAGEIGAGHTVTALYELVLAGGTLPSRTDAPPAKDGAPSSLPREIKASDLALVKVRWKDIDATQESPAREQSQALAAGEVLEAIAVADPDLQWAAAVAAFSEVLKKSPYADPGALATVKSIVTAQAGRDADRTEFAALLQKVTPLLGAR